MGRLVTTPDAYQLLHDGYLALSEVEAAGVRVDDAYLDRALAETKARIKEYDAVLRADPLYNTWRKLYGEKTNLGSHEQLARLVFGELGIQSKRRTESDDRESGAEDAYKHVNIPFVKTWFEQQKYIKVHGTYLTGIKREMVRGPDGLWYVHPVYNGNRAITHRSTCCDPNFQNNPVRNPLAGEYVRRCYVPRPGYQMLELDYGQIEVRIPCCYHSDPVLMDYVNDPTKDMHRDTACQLFMMKPGEVGKEVRHVAKNEFVFPTFYGSYYAQCAPHIWETLEHRNLKVEGTSRTVREHLASKGIRELGACNPKEEPVRGTFEYLVKEIEEDFWGNRFKVYAQWKRDWYANYLRQGGFRMLSGFAINLPLDRKQVCNSPIQGVAFHCCLWALIRIVRHLRRYKMRTRVIGEVHDCINFDAHPAERDDVIYMARRIMTEEIKRWAPWLNIPLVVEPEACPIDASWFDKMALREQDGTWVPEKLDKWESKYGLWSSQLAI